MLGSSDAAQGNKHGRSMGPDYCGAQWTHLSSPGPAFGSDPRWTAPPPSLGCGQGCLVGILTSHILDQRWKDMEASIPWAFLTPSHTPTAGKGGRAGLQTLSKDDIVG